MSHFTHTHPYIYLYLWIYAYLCLVAQSCLTLWKSMDYSLPGSSVYGDSPGKNTGVGCHALLHGIFPTQGSNPVLPIAGGFFTSWPTREAQRRVKTPQNTNDKSFPEGHTLSLDSLLASWELTAPCPHTRSSEATRGQDMEQSGWISRGPPLPFSWQRPEQP